MYRAFLLGLSPSVRPIMGRQMHAMLPIRALAIPRYTTFFLRASPIDRIPPLLGPGFEDQSAHRACSLIGPGFHLRFVLLRELGLKFSSILCPAPSHPPSRLWGKRRVSKLTRHSRNSLTFPPQFLLGPPCSVYWCDGRMWRVNGAVRKQRSQSDGRDHDGSAHVVVRFGLEKQEILEFEWCLGFVVRLRGGQAEVESVERVPEILRLLAPPPRWFQLAQ